MSIIENEGNGYGYFYCFTCGASGDVFSYVSLKEKIPFMQAVKYVSELLIRHPQIQSESYYPAYIKPSLRKSANSTTDKTVNLISPGNTVGTVNLH